MAYVSNWLAGDAYNRSGIAAQQAREITSLQQTQHAQARELTDTFNEDLGMLQATRYRSRDVSANRDLQVYDDFLAQHEQETTTLENIQNNKWQELRTRHAGERGQSTQPPAYY